MVYLLIYLGWYMQQNRHLWKPEKKEGHMIVGHVWLLCEPPRLLFFFVQPCLRLLNQTNEFEMFSVVV